MVCVSTPPSQVNLAKHDGMHGAPAPPAQPPHSNAARSMRLPRLKHQNAFTCELLPGLQCAT